MEVSDRVFNEAARLSFSRDLRIVMKKKNLVVRVRYAVVCLQGLPDFVFYHKACGKNLVEIFLGRA